MHLPYTSDYASSGRSSCRNCVSKIDQGTLRLGVMLQSPEFDGKIPDWYHFDCFFSGSFTIPIPKSIDDIANLESLRYDDQEKICAKITSATNQGKKRKKPTRKEFVLEYSELSSATCRICEEKIIKEEVQVRILKKGFETDVGQNMGQGHHLVCFATLRSELDYYECGDKLAGYQTLNKEDQAEVKRQLPAIEEGVPEKKFKLEDEVDSSNIEKEIKSQNKVMFGYRDQLQSLSKKKLQLLLRHNDQEVPPGKDKILDRLADIMTFGALEHCDKCNGGQLVFRKSGYFCESHLTEFTKCDAFIKEPTRCPFQVPPELADEYPFLSEYVYIEQTRAIRHSTRGSEVKRETLPLCNMEFAIVGNFEGKDEGFKKQIALLGGKIVTQIKNSVMAVIGTVEDVEKMGARIREVKDAGVHVVSEDFLTDAKDYLDRIPELVIKKSICDWGADPHLPPEPSSSSISKSSSKVMLTSKPGGFVDPQSGLADTAHIYISCGEKYTAVLTDADVQKEKNSYYRLQLLESDSGNEFWLYKSWGRTGTKIGGFRVESFSLDEAKQRFREIYFEKTGNYWEDRRYFQKIQGLKYHVDIEDGYESERMKINTDVTSTLSPPIQDLVKLIFNVEMMKTVMLEFELDIEKMPLGKLSKVQLQKAYEVLTELQQLINYESSETSLIDASNRFYHYVPHSFGTDNPPVINNNKILKKKIEMVDNLMEIEIAYNIIKITGNDNTIDDYYKKLNTDVSVLEKETEDFKIISEYVKNTHTEYHNKYKLEIDDVFIVKRQDEEKRFQPFQKYHRKLLWHGSRSTNYASILSKGLLIAPAEAPVTGYMFGKGIYFADRVSKSANYCHTSPDNSTGILLLCEVALGEMYELESKEFIQKLPKGKHSVKGVGSIQPDPEHVRVLSGGIEVPLGKCVVTDKSKARCLRYNEYIVYDKAQVNIKYLVKLNFTYK